VGELSSLAIWHFPGGTTGSSFKWAATSNVEVGQMRSIVGPLIPKFKTKVVSELLNPQTSHQSSSFFILLICN